MNTEQKLRYMMYAYEKGEYRTWDFTSQITKIYYHENDGTIPQEADEAIKGLIKKAEYFSPSEEDHKMYSGFTNENDVKTEAHKIYLRLLEIYGMEILWDSQKENIDK